MAPKKDSLQPLIYLMNRVEIRNYLLNNLENGEYKGTIELNEGKTYGPCTAKALRWITSMKNKPIAFSVLYKTKKNAVHYNSVWIQKNGKKLMMYYFDSGATLWEGMTNIMIDWLQEKVIQALQRKDYEVDFVRKMYRIQKITDDKFCQTWSLIWLQQHSIHANMKKTDKTFGSLNKIKAVSMIKSYLRWWYENNDEFKKGWIEEVVRMHRFTPSRSEELIAKDLEKPKF
jgi:hypothetical protein